MTITLTIPWDVKRCADNTVRRLHWAQRSSLFRQARQLARLSWLEQGRPQAEGPVRVSVVIRRGRLLDHANAWGGLKPTLDGVFCDALTPDDSPKWVSLGELRQEVAPRYRGREEVVLTVEPIGEEQS